MTHPDPEARARDIVDAWGDVCDRAGCDEGSPMARIKLREMVSAALREREARIAELESVARLVDDTERSRGYPMPEEWARVVRAARSVL